MLTYLKFKDVSFDAMKIQKKKFGGIFTGNESKMAGNDIFRPRIEFFGH